MLTRAAQFIFRRRLRTPENVGDSLISGYSYIGIPAAGVTAKAVTGTRAGNDLANGAAIDTGNLKVFRGRVQQTLYKGTVTVPIVATDAAPGDDGNDLSTRRSVSRLTTLARRCILSHPNRIDRAPLLRFVGEASQ